MRIDTHKRVIGAGLVALVLAALMVIALGQAAHGVEPAPKVHRTWSGTPFPASRPEVPRTWHPTSTSTARAEVAEQTRDWSGTPFPASRRTWSGGSVFYVIVPGDTLYGITARFCGDGSLWPAVAEHNGIEGTLIYAGDFLRVLCP